MRYGNFQFEEEASETINKIQLSLFTQPFKYYLILSPKDALEYAKMNKTAHLAFLLARKKKTWICKNYIWD